MATFTVTNTNNSGEGSLREAIDDANDAAGLDVINFSFVSGTIALTSGELQIKDSVTIQGSGITVSGSNQFRVFTIDDIEDATQIEVAIDGLTITNGSAYDGGGILNQEKLTITNSSITQNTGNMSFQEEGVGGGINNRGDLTLINSTISGNVATDGGGIHNYLGEVKVINSTISGNTATGKGGGIYSGGLESGQLTVTNSTISGNTVISTDPEITATGGGIYNGGRAEITNTTIANNSASSGGGLYSYLSNSTKTLTITNTIIANSTGGDFVNSNNGSNNVTSNNNLVEDGSLAGAIAQDPLLDPLSNYGGPTQTHQLQAGSPAINKGNNANVTTDTDQRGTGFSRIADGIVDIGAFEVQVSTPLPQLSINNSVEVIDDPKLPSNAVFTVTLSATSSVLVTVQYSYQDNTALAGVDYTAVSGTLTLNPGQTTATITVPIISDEIAEPAESFFLNLSNPSNATIANSQGSATILSFDPAQYGASNPDLIPIYGYNLEALTNHYLQFGRFEPRPVDSFDEFRYIASSYVGTGDLITAFGNKPNIDIAGATEHYIRSGYSEGRYLNAFDPARYLNSHQNLLNFYDTNKVEATKHFITNGFTEGYSPDLFASDRYIASYPDLIEAFRYNLEAGSDHYLFFGRGASENRTISFDPVAYLAKYFDVASEPFYGASLERATQHYILVGYNEGRSPV